MRNDNLAYDTEYRYRKPAETGTHRQITNIRTAGGVMIRTGNSEKRKVNTQVSPKGRSKARITKSTIVSVLVIAAMAFLVLFRGLMINSGYEKLAEKQTQLSDIVAENQKLQFKIDQTLDLKNIERVAENNFNMGQPTKSQMIYVNLDQENEVKKIRESSSLVEAVKNFFGSIVEYFA